MFQVTFLDEHECYMAYDCLLRYGVVHNTWIHLGLRCNAPIYPPNTVPAQIENVGTARKGKPECIVDSCVETTAALSQIETVFQTERTKTPRRHLIDVSEEEASQSVTMARKMASFSFPGSEPDRAPSDCGFFDQEDAIVFQS